MIDLAQQHCNCKDFHRIEFCKHLAAIQAHFPHLCSEGNTKVMVLAQELCKNLNPEHLRPAHNLGTLLQKVSILSWTLATQPNTKLDSSLAIFEVFRTLKHSLMAAIASRQVQADRSKAGHDPERECEGAKRGGGERMRRNRGKGRTQNKGEDKRKLKTRMSHRLIRWTIAHRLGLLLDSQTEGNMQNGNTRSGARFSCLQQGQATVFL